MSLNDDDVQKEANIKISLVYYAIVCRETVNSDHREQTLWVIGISEIFILQSQS